MPFSLLSSSLGIFLHKRPLTVQTVLLVTLLLCNLAQTNSSGLMVFFGGKAVTTSS